MPLLAWTEAREECAQIQRASGQDALERADFRFRPRPAATAFARRAAS